MQLLFLCLMMIVMFVSEGKSARQSGFAGVDVYSVAEFLYGAALYGTTCRKIDEIFKKRCIARRTLTRQSSHKRCLRCSATKMERTQRSVAFDTPANTRLVACWYSICGHRLHRHVRTVYSGKHVTTWGCTSRISNC